MPRGTTLRNVRVSDELWDEAMAIAERRGQNVSQVIRDALAVYVMRHGSRNVASPPSKQSEQ